MLEETKRWSDAAVAERSVFSLGSRWWICILALPVWLLTRSSQRSLSSDAEFWFCWAADKRLRLMQFRSHAAISASLGWSGLQERPRSQMEYKTEKKRREAAPESPLRCFSSNSRKPISGLGCFSYIPVTDFYFSIKGSGFFNSLAHLVALSQHLGTS